MYILQISLQLLSSVLLSHTVLSPTAPTPPAFKHPKVTIIDTTGSFPIALLAQVLTSRLKRERERIHQRMLAAQAYRESPRWGGEDDSAEVEIGVAEEVGRLMEMVGISRVFDVEGLWEVLGEVTDVGSKGVKGSSAIGENTGGEISKLEKVGEIFEIGDSQDENDEEVGDENWKQQPPSRHPQGQSGYLISNEQRREEDSGMEMIIVDSMAHIINELFARKEKNEGANAYSLTMPASPSIQSPHSSPNHPAAQHIPY